MPLPPHLVRTFCVCYFFYGIDKVYGDPTTYVTRKLEDKKKDIGVKTMDFGIKPCILA